MSLRLNMLFALLALLAMALLAPGVAEAKGNAAQAKQIVQLKGEIRQLKKQKLIANNSIAFWKQKERRWTLYLNQSGKPCWEVNLRGPLKLCMTARGAVRANQKKYREAEKRIERLEYRLVLMGALEAHKWEPDRARELGREMAASRGWTGAQWNCLDDLWDRLESGWKWWADNPTSDAYGIPQALPGTKMGRKWLHDVFTQIKWGLGYIAGRFGTPCNARAFRLANGWY